MATDRSAADVLRRATNVSDRPQTTAGKVAAEMETHPAVDSVEHAVGDGMRHFWVTFSQTTVPYEFADCYDAEFVSAWPAPPSFPLRRLFVPRSRLRVQFRQERMSLDEAKNGGDADAE